MAALWNLSSTTCQSVHEFKAGNKPLRADAKEITKKAYDTLHNSLDYKKRP